jgi:uncharacterized membrane protein YkvA (DUF1232 family)
MARLTSWLLRPGLLLTLFSRLRLAVRLVREPRVPFLIEALPVLVALYVLSPIDLVPDIFPLLGQLDDLTLVVVTIGTFLRLCPPEPVAFHQAAIARRAKYSPMPAGDNVDNVIDAEWRRE